MVRSLLLRPYPHDSRCGNRQRPPPHSYSLPYRFSSQSSARPVRISEFVVRKCWAGDAESGRGRQLPPGFSTSAMVTWRRLPSCGLKFSCRLAVGPVSPVSPFQAFLARISRERAFHNGIDRRQTRVFPYSVHDRSYPVGVRRQVRAAGAIRGKIPWAPDPNPSCVCKTCLSRSWFFRT